MTKKLFKISEAAKILGVSIDTLRRWDKKGYLKSVRASTCGHRYYKEEDLEFFLNDIFVMARNWVLAESPQEPAGKFYCADSPTFQSRLNKLEKQLQDIPGLESIFSLITSIAGEIGNNSFDHNLGSWPDVRGILFAYDLNKRKIILADRGQGVLKTLKKVRPALAADEDALNVAFTETISGRSPENRGNGLKYVRRVVAEISESTSLTLYFQSGSAILNLKHGDAALNITRADFSFHGCLALIGF